MDPPHPLPTFKGDESEIQWVEISGSNYSVDELDLVRWLQMYGKILSAVSEKENFSTYCWTNTILDQIVEFPFRGSMKRAISTL